MRPCLTTPPGRGRHLPPTVKPPVKRLEYGSITLPSGRLCVGDPGLHPDGTPPPVALRPGTHPVVVLINGSWWAYAAILLSDATPVRWQCLGEIAVDCGAACFMSAEASDPFVAWRPADSDLMDELWDPFHEATAPAVKDQVRPPPRPFHLRLDDDPAHAIPIGPPTPNYKAASGTA
jgi:hypothetical protein